MTDRLVKGPKVGNFVCSRCQRLYARRHGWGEDGLCRPCRSALGRQSSLKSVGKPTIRRR